MIIQAEGLGWVGPKSGRTKSGLVFLAKNITAQPGPKSKWVESNRFCPCGNINL